MSTLKFRENKREENFSHLLSGLYFAHLQSEKANNNKTNKHTQKPHCFVSCYVLQLKLEQRRSETSANINLVFAFYYYYYKEPKSSSLLLLVSQFKLV